jgi:hypothetical protein
MFGSPASGQNPWAGVLPERCKEFWPRAFSLSTRRRTMNDFALYLPGCFGVRCRMVEFYPKTQKSIVLPRRERRKSQKSFTVKDAEDAKEKDQVLPLMETDDTDLEKVEKTVGWIIRRAKS